MKADPTVDPRGGRFLRRHGKYAVASIVVVLVFAWILRAGTLPLIPQRGELAKVDVTAFAAFVAAMTAHLLLRYGRCHYLVAAVETVPLRRLMAINAVAMALVTLLPLRLGEMSRPLLLRDKGRLSFGAITGTVAAERIIDGLAFSILLLAGLTVARPGPDLPDHIGNLAVPASVVPRAAGIAALAFAGGFVLMLGFYLKRDLARRMTRGVVGLVSTRLAERVTGLVERLSEGLSFMAQPRFAIPYLLLTILGLVTHVVAVQALAVAVGIPQLGFAQSSVLVGVLALGFAMPNAPGFFGQVQLAIYAGLAVYLSPAQVVGPGATMAFLFYVSYVALVFGLAGVSLLVGYGPELGPALASAAPDGGDGQQGAGT